MECFQIRNIDQLREAFVMAKKDFGKSGLLSLAWSEHGMKVEEVDAPLRSIPQNQFSFEIYTRIGKQLYGGDTEHARRECKLEHGVPILREESADFREVYDKVIRPHDYETKLKIMAYLPVTSIMSKKQFAKYTNKIADIYSPKGVDFGDLFDERKRA